MGETVIEWVFLLFGLVLVAVVFRKINDRIWPEVAKEERRLDALERLRKVRRTS